MKPGTKLHTRHAVYFAKGGVITLCSCVLKDGKIVLCLPKNKIKDARWKSDSVRHNTKKIQIVFKDLQRFNYYIRCCVAALKDHKKVLRRKV